VVLLDLYKSIKKQTDKENKMSNAIDNKYAELVYALSSRFITFTQRGDFGMVMDFELQEDKANSYSLWCLEGQMNNCNEIVVYPLWSAEYEEHYGNGKSSPWVIGLAMSFPHDHFFSDTPSGLEMSMQEAFELATELEKAFGKTVRFL
jgi:hypothetical protein